MHYFAFTFLFLVLAAAFERGNGWVLDIEAFSLEQGKSKCSSGEGVDAFSRDKRESSLREEIREFSLGEGIDAFSREPLTAEFNSSEALEASIREFIGKGLSRDFSLREGVTVNVGSWVDGHSTVYYQITLSGVNHTAYLEQIRTGVDTVKRAYGDQELLEVSYHYLNVHLVSDRSKKRIFRNDERIPDPSPGTLYVNIDNGLDLTVNNVSAVKSESKYDLAGSETVSSTGSVLRGFWGLLREVVTHILYHKTRGTECVAYNTMVSDYNLAISICATSGKKCNPQISRTIFERVRDDVKEIVTDSMMVAYGGRADEGDWQVCGWAIHKNAISNPLLEEQCGNYCRGR